MKKHRQTVAPATRKKTSPSEAHAVREPDSAAQVNMLSLLRATLESTADGILVVNQEGRWVDHNQQFVRLWQLPPEIVATRDDRLALDYVVNQLKDPDTFLAKVQTLYANPDADSFDVLEFKDGRVFERYSRPQLVEERPVGRVWSFRDVTRQKRIEAALRESAAQLQTIFNVARDGFLVADIATKRLSFANPKMCEMTGYREAELLDMNVYGLHSTQDMSRAMEQFDCQARGETECAEGVPILRKDGSRFFCDVSGAPFEMGGRQMLLGLFRDVTERKQAEEALRTSEHWLKESQRVSRVGSYVLDISAGTWTSSEVLDEVFGINPRYPHTVQGWADLVHPDERQAMMDYFTVEVLQNGVPFNREYRIVRQTDGQTRWVHGHGALFFDANNRPVTMAGTIQDITERKRAEEENLRLEAQILQTQKLESLGVLAGGIAHDFNNMLMVILGNAELASRETQTHSPAHVKIKGITDVANRAAELCNQMLAYSGKGRFLIQSIDVSAFVDDMGHMLDVAISKKASLRCNLARGLPAIEADVTQLRQVIMNLVINASEAIGERSGIITITTGSVQWDARDAHTGQWHGAIAEGPHVFLEVADTGCGMDEDTIKKIFDPFFTTKFSGRGLGLAAVLGIVRSHKAAIRIHSTPGQGATFTILFPTTALPPELVQPPVPVDNAAWQGHGLVLLVDDEETVRNICRLLLEAIGFEVLSAADGLEAVALYGTHHEQIRCVLLDLTMPNMDGAETFAELRKLHPAARVILSSGYSEESVLAQFAGMGIAGFIQKPYQLSTLKSVIKSALGT